MPSGFSSSGFGPGFQGGMSLSTPAHSGNYVQVTGTLRPRLTWAEGLFGWVLVAHGARVVVRLLALNGRSRPWTLRLADLTAVELP